MTHNADTTLPAPKPSTGAGTPKWTSCADIDWPRWQPQDVATLTFVFRPEKPEASRVDEILLIRKLRGLGAGKINGPGGRLEGEETLVQCAVREVQEELGGTPLDPVERGRLDFQFVDGYSLRCHVFGTRRFQGSAVETEEAVPLWTPVDRIPFDQMWSDDILWFPHLLAQRPFVGQFIFDDDTMVDVQLRQGVDLRLDMTL